MNNSQKIRVDVYNLNYSKVLKANLTLNEVCEWLKTTKSKVYRAYEKQEILYAFGGVKIIEALKREKEDIEIINSREDKLILKLRLQEKEDQLKRFLNSNKDLTNYSISKFVKKLQDSIIELRYKIKYESI